MDETTFNLGPTYFCVYMIYVGRLSNPTMVFVKYELKIDYLKTCLKNCVH